MLHYGKHINMYFLWLWGDYYFINVLCINIYIHVFTYTVRVLQTLYGCSVINCFRPIFKWIWFWAFKNNTSLSRCGCQMCRVVDMWLIYYNLLVLLALKNGLLSQWQNLFTQYPPFCYYTGSLQCSGSAGDPWPRTPRGQDERNNFGAGGQNK